MWKGAYLNSPFPPSSSNSSSPYALTPSKWVPLSSPSNSSSLRGATGLDDMIANIFYRPDDKIQLLWRSTPSSSFPSHRWPRRFLTLLSFFVLIVSPLTSSLSLPSTFSVYSTSLSPPLAGNKSLVTSISSDQGLTWSSPTPLPQVNFTYTFMRFNDLRATFNSDGTANMVSILLYKSRTLFLFRYFPLCAIYSPLCAIYSSFHLVRGCRFRWRLSIDGWCKLEPIQHHS